MDEPETTEGRDYLEPRADVVSWSPSLFTLEGMQIDPQDVVRFLARLSVEGNISAACRYSGISRSTVYRMQDDVPEFRHAMQLAIENAADVIDLEIHRRAVVGIKRKVFQGGKQVDVVREFSDQLLALRAKALHPAYKDVGKSNVNVAAVAGAANGATAGPPVPPVERTDGTPDHVLTLGEGIAKLAEIAQRNDILPGNMRVERDDEPPADVPDDLGGGSANGVNGQDV